MHNRGYETPDYNFEQDKQNWETNLFIEPTITGLTDADGVQYTGPNGYVTVSGTRYYRWTGQQGIFTLDRYTTSATPAEGNTLYSYLRYPSAHVTAVSTVLHINYDTVDTQLPEPTLSLDGRALTVTTSKYNPTSFNNIRFLLWVKDTDGDIIAYPGNGRVEGPTTYNYFQLDTDGVDFAHTLQVGAQLIDTGNILQSSDIVWVDIN